MNSFRNAAPVFIIVPLAYLLSQIGDLNSGVHLAALSPLFFIRTAREGLGFDAEDQEITEMIGTEDENHVSIDNENADYSALKQNFLNIMQ